MYDSSKIPDVTIEGLLVLFVLLYLGLQYADPLFVIFQFVADILLYLVIAVIILLAGMVVYEISRSIAITAYDMLMKWWENRKEPEFDWVEIEELE